MIIKAWDGKNYSNTNTIRITIDNPSDAENIVPEFNSSTWVNKITLYCDSNPTKQDRCNGGISIDLTEHFSDPDGVVSSSTDGLVFDVFDDLTTLADDDYGDYLTFSNGGVVSYNPAYVTGLSNEVSEWSIVGLMFEARDSYGSVAYSYKINIVVVEVSFNVIQQPSEPLSPDNPAIFCGQGNDGPRNIIFEMDDQVFSEPDGSSDALFMLGAEDGESSNFNFLLFGIIAFVVLALLGAGMFFFQVEYDDLDTEAESLAAQEQVADDPYAWAKARQQPVAIPSAQVATTPVVVQPEAATAHQAGQHPGWIWDAESNNWVPDPNYSPEQ